MSLINTLKMLNQKLAIGRYSYSCFDIDKLKDYLTLFPEPSDLIDRSYYQNKCQNKLQGIFRTFLYNLASAFLLIPFMIMYMYILKEKDVRLSTDSIDTVSTMDFKSKGILPELLEEEFRKNVIISDDKGSLEKDDLQYIAKLIRKYPFSFYFIFKSMCMIAVYSRAIRLYKPKAILTYGEYSFVSSVLTGYCHSKNVEHINIMHGEKMFNIRDSFFQFDRCFVWDNHYVKLFKNQRAVSTQFVIYPLKTMTLSRSFDTPIIDYKYYLQVHNEEQLSKIRDALIMLKSKGKSIAVRLHPSYSNKAIIDKYFDIDDIEDPRLVSIENSLASCCYAVSICSTVLRQAYQSGIPCVLDDLSNPDKHQQLIDRDYILMSKPHLLLSNVIKKESGENYVKVI